MQVTQTTARTTDVMASALRSPYLYKSLHISGGGNRAESRRFAGGRGAVVPGLTVSSTNFMAEALFVASCRWIGKSRSRASRRRPCQSKLGLRSEGGRQRGSIPCFARGGQPQRFDDYKEELEVKLKHRESLPYRWAASQNLDLLQYLERSKEEWSRLGRSHTKDISELSAPQQTVLCAMLDHLSGPPPSRWQWRRWVNLHCLAGTGKISVILHLLDKVIEEHPFVLIMAPYLSVVDMWRKELNEEGKKGCFDSGKIPVLPYSTAAEKKDVEERVSKGQKCIVLACVLHSKHFQADLFAKHKDKWTFVLDESHLLLPKVTGHQDQAYMNRLPAVLPERALFVSETPSQQVKRICTLTAEMVIRPSGKREPQITLVDQNGFDEIATKKCRDLLEKHWQASSGGAPTRKQAVIFVKTGEEGERLLTKLRKALSKEKDDAADLAHLVTSKMEAQDKVDLISKFRDGQFPILITINMLKEGEEFPHVELVMISAADKQNGIFRREDNLAHMVARACWSAFGRAFLGVQDAKAKQPQSIQNLFEESRRHRGKQDLEIEKEILLHTATRGVKAKVRAPESSTKMAIERRFKGSLSRPPSPK